MLIIAGSLDVNVNKFIELIRESTCEFEVEAFDAWQQNSKTPTGFVYIKVMPEISLKRLTAAGKNVTLEDIQERDTFLHNYFIDKTIMPKELHTIPVLALNGFIDFETDISQFYNHL